MNFQIFSFCSLLFRRCEPQSKFTTMDFVFYIITEIPMAVLKNALPREGGLGEGTPLYGLYRYMRPHRV